MREDHDSGVSGGQSGLPGDQSFIFAGTPFPEVFARDDFDQRQAKLATIIEQQIVPRLLKFHQVDRGNSRKKSDFLPEEVAEFGVLAMGPDIDTAKQYFERLRTRGHSFETLFEEFLAPTARYLGQLWCDDLCDFVDVTIGVARLQQIMAMFGAVAELPVVDIERRALLLSIPGEQHLFGIDFVARAMRSAGWDVALVAAHSLDEVADLVSREWFGVVGMTLGANRGLQDLAQTIATVRRASQNAKVSIMVGGHAFLDNPQAAVQIGADAVADDAIAAVVLAKKLLLSQIEGWR